MSPPPSSFSFPVVPLHLVSTGSDPFENDLLLLSALVLEEGSQRRFHALLRPRIPPSSALLHLHGISEESFLEARTLQQVAREFLKFLPEKCLLLSHRFAVDRSFLQLLTESGWDDHLLDTQLLSRIAFPSLPSHDLWALQDLLGTQLDEGDDPCTVLGKLWDAIWERLVSLPAPVVYTMRRWVHDLSNRPLRFVLESLGGATHEPGLGTWPAFESHFRSEPVPPVDAERSEAEIREMPSPEEISASLGSAGFFAKELAGYEEREGQRVMAQAVTEAFMEGKHLMVEAGTGVGKSLAYLVPSVFWSITQGCPVVVSTNTKNLQAQLYHKDLPLIRKALNLPFREALLKGRTNYICLRKFQYIFHEYVQELDAEERISILPIVPWIVETDTGDLSECGAASHWSFQSLRAKLTTPGEECLGRKCSHYKKCFLVKARAKALASDLVVANHALVFAEMDMTSPALPPYDYIVFDEAHNLEAAATQHLSVEISSIRINLCLRRLWRPSRRGKGTGLLPSIRHQCESLEYRGDTQTQDAILRTSQQATAAVAEMDGLISPFFLSLLGLLQGDPPRSSLRLSGETKEEDSWIMVNSSRGSLITGMARVLHACEDLANALLSLEDTDMPYLLEFRKELEGIVLRLRELSSDIDFVLDTKDEEYVFWVERTSRKRGGARAMAAPIQVGPLLRERVYIHKESVIFSSATLSVRGDFGFLRKRLGLDQEREDSLLELQAGTPFDYPEQCVVMVPTFLPEPGDSERNYAVELGELLVEVFLRTQGRAMALFTSYDMLKKSTSILAESGTLMEKGIRVLVQGLSGSRDGITTLFRKDIHSVLLGTHSFWEGVDVIGESLSCLVVARLPFAVYTDPVIQARCERVEQEGHDAFLGYTLPSAIIRLRQGFGRLIRHRTDRGVVIVADRRIATKRYGSWFRSSLPAPSFVFPQRDRFVDALNRFLEGENWQKEVFEEYDLSETPW